METSERPEEAGSAAGAGPLRALSRHARRLRDSVFVRQVATMAGGTAVAQVISVAFAPLLARLYGPEAFGVVAVFLAVLGFLVPLSTGAYSLSIVLPKHDAQARALVRLSVAICLILTAVALALLAGLHDSLATAIGFGTEPALLLLVPVSLLVMGLQPVARQWLVRRRRFRAIAQVAVVDAAAGGTVKALAGLAAASPAMLLVLTVAGQVLHTLLLALAGRRRPETDKTEPAPEPAGVPAGAPPASLPWAARAYSDFPLYRMPQSWLNSVGLGLPALLLGLFFAPSAAGFYAIANRVLGVPATVIVGAVGPAMMPRIAETAHTGLSVRPLLVKATLGLAAIGLVPFGVLVVYGPSLFGFVFGDEWTRAGDYASWLALSTYAVFVSVPAVQAVPVLRLQPWLLAYEIASLAAGIAALAIGALALGSDLNAIACYAAATAVLQLALAGIVLARSGHAVAART
jgi:O-antigen/teichoic acid export membrane protein